MQADFGWTKMSCCFCAVACAVGCALGRVGSVLCLFNEGWRDAMLWMRLGGGEWVMMKVVD